MRTCFWQWLPTAQMYMMCHCYNCLQVCLYVWEWLQFLSMYSFEIKGGYPTVLFHRLLHTCVMCDQTWPNVLFRAIRFAAATVHWLFLFSPSLNVTPPLLWALGSLLVCVYCVALVAQSIDQWNIDMPLDSLVTHSQTLYSSYVDARQPLTECVYVIVKG